MKRAEECDTARHSARRLEMQREGREELQMKPIGAIFITSTSCSTEPAKLLVIV